MEGGGWGGVGCLRLTIARNSSGGVSGTVRHDGAPRFGPFSPASNPDIGYPVEVAPTHYQDLQGGDNGVDYRILDGAFVDQQLTFTWSFVDLWSPWCQLQLPYPWRIQARELYFCVPQDSKEQAAFDEGKVALCRTAAFEDLCSNADGTPTPCECTDVSSCSTAVCRCDSRGCDADLIQARLQGAWTLAGDQLTGGFSDTVFQIPLTLMRGTP
jgi:hypothetical protein